MIEKLSNTEIEEVLNRNILGRIGCHADNTTYVVPISYAYDGTYMYGHSKEGMKLDIMRKNPSVCFEVEETKDLANWKSVIAWGDYEELSDPEERKKALQALIDKVIPVLRSSKVHNSDEWPFSPDNLNTIKGVVFRIRLQNKTGRFEQNMTTSFFG